MHLSASYGSSVRTTMDWCGGGILFARGLRRRGLTVPSLMPFSSSHSFNVAAFVSPFASASILSTDTPCTTIPYFCLWILSPSNALFQFNIRTVLASSGDLHCNRIPLVILLIPLSFGFSSVSVLIMSWQRLLIWYGCISVIVFCDSLSVVVRVTWYGSRCFLSVS